MKPTTLSPTLYPTSKQNLEVTSIGHAAILLRYGDAVIQVDPYSAVADYSLFPKADLILITHHHSDHFDPSAIHELSKPTTQIIAPPLVIEKLGYGISLRNGAQTTWHEVTIHATAAYNRISMRHPGEPFHIKGQGNGYLIEVDNRRLYIAADTELIPEMELLGPIDIAFLPKNMPYTMSDQMFIEAARLIHPTYLYPYHYFEIDWNTLKKALPGIHLAGKGAGYIKPSNE